MNILDLASSVLTGGATGLIGAAISRFADYKTEKLKFTSELELRKADAEIAAAEWAARTKVASIEADAVVDKADSEAFAKSFNEPERYSAGVAPSRGEGWLLVLVDVIRALVRPGLTLYLATITTYLYWDAHAIIRGPMTPEAATALVNKIIETVLYLTTVCITWYFGVRTRSK
jgi:NAD dependent epimerase/dehydratase family enzyme